MVTLVLVPTVYTLFEEGWAGLKHKTPAPAPARPARLRIARQLV